MWIAKHKVRYSRSHLMTVHKIVINKQEPLLELWLASRLEGIPFAYKIMIGWQMMVNLLGFFNRGSLRLTENGNILMIELTELAPQKQT